MTAVVSHGKQLKNERSKAIVPKGIVDDIHEHRLRFFEYGRRPKTRSLWCLSKPGDFRLSSSVQNMGSALGVEVLVGSVAL